MNREPTSYRMPYPALILVPFLIVIVAGSKTPLFFKMKSTAGKAHSGLLIHQIGEVLQEPPAIDTKARLIDRLKTANIDWNSCRLNGNELIDSWKNPIRIEFDRSEQCLTIQSGGPDRKFNTRDDLKSKLPVFKNP